MSRKKIYVLDTSVYLTNADCIYAFKNNGWSKTELSEFIGSIWQLSEYPVWDKFVSAYVNEVQII